MTKQNEQKTIIEGDEISAEELERQLNRRRMDHMKFEMERIRIDDTLDEMKKSSRRSDVMWRLKKLKREMNR